MLSKTVVLSRVSPVKTSSQETRRYSSLSSIAAQGPFNFDIIFCVQTAAGSGKHLHSFPQLSQNMWFNLVEMILVFVFKLP